MLRVIKIQTSFEFIVSFLVHVFPLPGARKTLD